MTEILRISSSLIQSVEYDSSERTLVILFTKSPHPYTYFFVPEEVFMQLKQVIAEGQSVGSWFSKNIKSNFLFEVAKPKKKKLSR